MNNISSYQKIITKKRGEVEAQVKRKNIIDEKLEELAIRSIAIEEAQVFIQSVAQATQMQIKYNLEPIIQILMDACFPGKYSFVIDFTIERNRTVARLLFLKEGNEVDPLSQCGGGIVDLVSFALRIALWSIGKTDNVIILDEPLKNLQPVELNKLGFEVIRSLSKKLGLQFIIVNNSIGSENLLEVSDKVFEVSMGKDGISKIKEAI